MSEELKKVTAENFSAAIKDLCSKRDKDCCRDLQHKLGKEVGGYKCFRIGSTGLVSSNGFEILFPDKHGLITTPGFYKNLRVVRDMETYSFVNGEHIRVDMLNYMELTTYLRSIGIYDELDIQRKRVEVSQMQLGESFYTKIIWLDGWYMRTTYVGVLAGKVSELVSLSRGDEMFEGITDYAFDLYYSNITTAYDALSSSKINIVEAFSKASWINATEIDISLDIVLAKIAAGLFKRNKLGKVYLSAQFTSAVKAVNGEDESFYHWDGVCLTPSQKSMSSIPFGIDITGLIKQVSTPLNLCHSDGSHPYTNISPALEYDGIYFIGYLSADDEIGVKMVSENAIIAAKPTDYELISLTMERYNELLNTKIRKATKGLSAEMVDRYNFRKLK